MGALGLAMVRYDRAGAGIGASTRPVNYSRLYEMLGAEPVDVRRTLLACDMGGFFLAKELAGGDVAAWLCTA